MVIASAYDGYDATCSGFRSGAMPAFDPNQKSGPIDSATAHPYNLVCCDF